MGWDFPWALSPESVVFLPEGNRVCNNPTGDILQKVIMEFLQKACSRERTVTTSLFSECVTQQAKQKRRIITVIDCKMATESLRVWMCSALLWDRLLFSILWNWVGHLTYTSSRHLKAPVSRACSLAVPGILGLPHEGAQAGPWEPSGGESKASYWQPTSCRKHQWDHPQPWNQLGSQLPTDAWKSPAEISPEETSSQLVRFITWLLFHVSSVEVVAMRH